jgi:hypothetical protein
VVVTVLVLALLLTPFATAAVVLRIEYAGDPGADVLTRNRDAIWLGHAWVDGRKTDADVAALKERLDRTGIRDLYVHTGPLEHDGGLPATVHPKARWFVDAVHRAMPRIRVQSWLGDVVAPRKRPGLELDRREVRDRITASSAQVLDLGFDGVHFDLEPVVSGSDGFLALLDQVRTLTRQRQAVFSIAAPQIQPMPGIHRLGHYWSPDYFAAAARRVDQIAVMSYDTSMPLESLYGGYVAHQTALALEHTSPDVDLLMGLPAYWDNDPSHWGHAETVEAAVRGARLGLEREAPDRRSFGLALYVDFTATDAHWNAYRDGWCASSG